MGRDANYNGGAFVRSALALVNTAITAGGSGDNTAANGGWVDRKGDKGIATSAKLIVAFTAVLAANTNLMVGVQFQDALDAAGTGGANYEAAVPAAIKASSVPGGTVSDTAEFDVDLGGARRFIRAVVTPNLSAASADTATVNAIWLFFGDHRGPATKSTVNTGSADAI